MPQTTMQAGPIGSAWTTELGAETGQVAVQITGLTASGAVLTPQASYDSGVTWNSLVAYPLLSNTSQSTITADGVYKISTAAAGRVALAVTSAGTGTIFLNYRSGEQNLLNATPTGSGGGGGGTSSTVTLAAGTSSVGTVALATGTGVLSTPASTTVNGGSLSMTTVGNVYTITNGGNGALGVTLAGLTASGGVVQFKASDNGSTFYVFGGINGAANTRFTQTGADGSYSFSVSGRAQMQIVVLTAGTGSVAVSYTLSPEARVVTVDSGPVNPVYVSTTPTSAGLGTDASANKPTSLSATLATGTVINPGALYVQNQSAAGIQLWLGGAPGAAGVTPILIAQGAGANTQGGDWQAASNAPWFTGTFTVLGASGAQVGVRSN